jgi:polyvinyl alcohol dehydrogenase (cytochrome)
MALPLILQAMESGSMKTQAAELNGAERYGVAFYLAIPSAKVAPNPPTAFCSGKTPPFRDSSQSPHWSGWSPDGTNTRFQDARNVGFTVKEVPMLKLKWAFGLGDGIVARSQPAVAGGRMFFGTQSGTVYSLNAQTGCIYWSFQAETGVRSAVAYAKGKLYFGDTHANAYSLDAATGKQLWKVHVDDHFAAMITAVPQLHGDSVYVAVSSSEEALPPLPSYECCTFRGSVIALDAATGKRVWKTYTIADAPQPVKKNKAGVQVYGPSGAGVWSTPTFDEKSNLLYVATGDNYSDPTTNTSDAVLALDVKTGKIVWSRQLTPNDAFNNGCTIPGAASCPDAHGPDFDFGQPPILVSPANGRRALVIGQKSGVAHALDPDRQGETLWQTRVGKGGPIGGIQWGSAADRDNMYVALSDLTFKRIVADKTVPEGYRLDLDPNQGGGLFALKLSSGEKVWSAKPPSCGERKQCSPSQSGAVTAMPGAVFSGSLDGHLRAYSTSTGEVLWDVDTVRSYETINGQPARGGALDGPGPVMAGGILYVNSGYGPFGGMPGHVLLAFSVDGK